MLFSNDELNQLDEINKPKIEKPKPFLKAQAKASVWIGVNAMGVLTINPINTDQKVYFFIKAESMEVANEILNSVPNTQKRGLFIIPQWNSNPISAGFSSYNFRCCAQWLSKAVTNLGYEKSKFYTITKEPHDIASEIYARNKAKHDAKSQESQEFINKTLAELEKLNQEKRVFEDKQIQDRLDKENQRFNDYMAEQQA